MIIQSAPGARSLIPFLPVLVALLVVGAYLVGAIPFGLIIARGFAGIDVRQGGSGNIGATNVARTAGKRLGAVTLLLDAAKGAAPVLAARGLEQPVAVIAAVGFATVLGHVFPIYLKFKGGKGVATGLGVFASITPLPTVLALGVFALVLAVVRIVSVGSLVASMVLVGCVVGLDGRTEVIALSVAVVALVLLRHRSNIERLLRRAEPGV